MIYDLLYIMLYILYIILYIYIYVCILQFCTRIYWYVHMRYGQNSVFSSLKFQTCAAQWWDDLTPCVHHGTNEHIWMVNGA